MRLHRIAARVANLGWYTSYMRAKPLDVINHAYHLLRMPGAEGLFARTGVPMAEFRAKVEEGEYDDLYEWEEKLAAAITEEEKEEAASQVTQDDPAEAPTWAYIDGAEPVQGTWLVHFSDAADAVARGGFKRGVEDVTKLGLTKHLPEFDRRHPGFNFAFVADGRDAVVAARSGKYGGEAVLFQAMGAKGYHYGDEENQVVFWGPNVRPQEIARLTRDSEGRWCVAVKAAPPGRRQMPRDHAFCGTYPQAVAWVKQNAGQYRKHVLGR